MGRSKPRTNKRPPPKPNRRNGTSPTLGSGMGGSSGSVPLAVPGIGQQPYFDPATAALFPPASALDPTDPSFPSAFQSWSTSALSQLGQLPRLTPSQLSAIAGAAAGVGDAGLFSAAAAHGAVGVAAPGQGLPIDLPASLAALFEAKLTLDREKAKLMRMQKELKGYREGVAAAGGSATGKGKEVAVEEELGECTCGRNDHAHEYPGSAHSGSDDYYYYDTEDECDCCSHDHSYIECDHEPGECDCPEIEDDHHHHQHHQHQHQHAHHDGEVDSDADEYEYEDGHNHTCGHHHDHHHNHLHGHHLPHGVEAAIVPTDELAAFLKANAGAAQHAAGQPLSAAAAAPPPLPRATNLPPPPRVPGLSAPPGNRTRLADDPERMDEAVRELFNWIKAVVWTIEQAAIVAGRRGWATTEAR